MKTTRLKEYQNGVLVGVSDGTEEEMQAHKALRQEASPESSFEEEDKTAEFEAKKGKEDRKKALIEKLDEDAKGTTIAQLKAEFNQFKKDLKELLK